MELNDLSVDSEILECDCPNCRIGANANLKGHICNKDGCTKLFNNIKCLQDHLTCHEPKHFECIWRNCGQRFAFNDVLNLHLFMHMHEQDKFDKSKTRKELHLEPPIDNNHVIGPLIFECKWKYCGQTFISRELLRNHSLSHSTRKSVPKLAYDKAMYKKKLPRLFTCTWNSCGETFVSRYLLKNHSASHSDGKCVPNPACDKTINNIIIPRLNFACNWKNCEQTFGSQELLNTHSASHSDGKPVTNPACNKTNNMTTFPHLVAYNWKDYRDTYDAQEFLKHHSPNHLDGKSVAYPGCHKTNCKILILHLFACNWTGCGETFASQELLKTHSASHSDGKSVSNPGCDNTNDMVLISRLFACNWKDCGETFDTQELLKTHAASHSDGKSVPNPACDKTTNKILIPRLFTCNWKGCGLNFDTHELLENHSASHSDVIYASRPACVKTNNEKLVPGDNFFKCPMCNKKFFRNEHLKIHFKSHINFTEAETCFEETEHLKVNTDAPSPDELEAINSQKLDDFEEFICDLKNCSQPFESAALLKLHRKFDHGPYSCTCSNCANDKHEPNVPKRHICDFAGCGKLFPTSSQLLSHGRLHTSVDTTEPFLYDLRGFMKVYKKRNKFRKCSCSNCVDNINHQNATKKHICDFDGCGKLFSAPSNLLRHTLSHTSTDNFKCGFKNCKKVYKNANLLQFHCQNSHGKMANKKSVKKKTKSNIRSVRGGKFHKCTCSNCTDNKCDPHAPKQHICDFEGCGKLFSLPSKLLSHGRVHKSDKLFVCNFANCTKSFSHLGILNKHRRLHADDKRYECLECGLKFTSLSYLAIHKKVHRFKKSQYQQDVVLVPNQEDVVLVPIKEKVNTP